jgi:hypothetical protein
MSTLERAIAIAAEAHAGQRDKGGAPYFLHPLRIMLTVSSACPRFCARSLQSRIFHTQKFSPEPQLATAETGSTFRLFGGKRTSSLWRASFASRN